MFRQYTHVQEWLPSVLTMKGKGSTLRETANHFGFAKEKEKVAEGLALHSDQGYQYTSEEYFALTEE